MQKILLFLIPCILINAEPVSSLDSKKSVQTRKNNIAIARMEERHKNIIKISNDIDKKVLRFNQIYNESKKMIQNSKCIELNMAIEFLKEELVTLKEDKSNKKIDVKGYKKMITDIVSKKNKKCRNKK